ncbi:sensor histidine kinase [Dyadobacter tibetensis]|uniref:sensor histidine kinase n=1 Tax=Dyadobacter tibetensis TaxID=1211851 RepID=UPI000472BEB3|nr:PAS domain-containing sensor histidine kinase [Dyadobacter tibetensis]
MTSTNFPNYLLQSIHRAPQGYLVFERESPDSPEWLCVYANEKAEKLWGISSLLGLSYQILFPEEYRRNTWYDGLEYRFQFPASGYIGAISGPNESEGHLTVWVRDISASHSENLLRHYMPAVTRQAEQSMLFGGWAWNLDNDAMEWTDGLYNLLGYSSANSFPEASKAFLLKHVHQDDQETVGRLLNQIADFDADYVLEFRICNQAGEEQLLYLKGYNLQNSYTKQGVSIATIFNISALRDMQGELERKVKDLNQSNADLEQFAYIASHDLQEPLRKIVSFGERLKVYTGEEADKEQQFYLERILNATRRMQEMINNLLEFSRVSSAVEAHISTDLNKIVRNTLSDLELLIQEKGADIQYDQLPILEANPSQMSQLITNLINNALKFSKVDVPVKISIRSTVVPPQRLDLLKLKRSQRYFSLIFEDNGIGFEDSNADKIFTIFKRLRGRSEYEGSGIGLSICKKVVERHHGLILAHGQPGVGATFEVILPEVQ